MLPQAVKESFVVEGLHAGDATGPFGFGAHQHSKQSLKPRSLVYTAARAMYGTLLTIFKLLSNALTAASGIFGLLTEFKGKDKRITRNGKIALAGIVVGFVFSGVIAYLEARNLRSAKVEHAREIKRLLRPLDDHMRASIVLSVPRHSGESFRFRPQLVKYFRNLLETGAKPDPSIPVFLTAPSNTNPRYFVARHKELPSAFRSENSELVELFDKSIAYSIQAFRSETCASLENRRMEPDLELGFDDLSLEDDPSAEWEYVLDNDYLALSRNLKLWVFRGTSRFTSIEDFPGSAVVVWLGPRDTEFTLDYLQINLRGASFETSNFTRIVGGGGGQFQIPENVAKLGGRKFRGYCYSIPQGTQGHSKDEPTQ